MPAISAGYIVNTKGFRRQSFDEPRPCGNDGLTCRYRGLQCGGWQCPL